MSKLNIMIVDDVEINRAIQANIFNGEYEIIEAENGRQALDILYSGKRIDMILLDLIMPVMDGIELMEIIKKDSRYCDIPIIVNTGENGLELEEVAFDLGADDFVTKPYNPRILKRRVNNLIEKYIVKNREAKKELLKTQDELNTLENTVPGGIAIFEIQDSLKLVYYSETMKNLFGYDDIEIYKISQDDVLSVIYEEDKGNLFDYIARIRKDTSLEKVHKITVRAYKSDGEVMWLSITSKRLQHSEDVPTYHTVFMDVTEEKRAEEKLYSTVLELRYRIEHDVLTGIFNKDTFFNEAQNFMLKDPTENYVIIAWNIDRFKVVNELFGREKGDEILINFAQFFIDTIGDEGVYARMESDNFATCTKESFFQAHKAQFEEIIDNGIQGDTIDHLVTIHMGIYLVDDIRGNIDLMFDRASLALASVKTNVIDRYGYYDEKMSALLMEEQEIINTMNEALEKRQFYIQYQPIVSTRNGAVVSAEALVRWEHPVKGTISPGLFIPLFEQNGFITKLDSFVREEVCNFIHENNELGIKDIPISINVSRINFYSHEFYTRLLEDIEKAGIGPESIKLEITESAYTENSKQLLELMSEFQEKGFLIMMDDFGSGYSSLNMLKDVPVNVLKIDMQFIKNIEESKRASDILYSIIEMAKKLQMQTVAEGVETRQQFELLKSMGCDTIQGYYFSKPLNPEEFRAYVYNRNYEMDRISEARDGRPKILLIEEIDITRASMKALLEKEYNVIEAANVKKAISILDEMCSDIKLIITGLIMRDMDGYRLIDYVKNNAILQNIPVVVVTADDEADDAVKAMNAGAMDVILKPFDVDIFYKRIEKIINVTGRSFAEKEMYQIREQNMYKQNIRKILDSEVMGICELKYQELSGFTEIVFRNNKFLDIFGMTNEEAEKDSLFDVIDEHLIQSATTFATRIRFATAMCEKQLQYLTSIERGEGDIVKILITAYIYYEEHGTDIRIFACELLRNNIINRESIELDIIRSFIKRSKDTFWVYDYEQDEFEYMVTDTFGERKLSVAKEGLEDIFEKNHYSIPDREKLRKMFDRVKNGEFCVQDKFCTIRKRDKKELWNRITIYNLSVTPEGKGLAFGIVKNIDASLERDVRSWQGVKFREILSHNSYIFAEVDLDANVFRSYDHEGGTKFDIKKITYDEYLQRFIEDKVYEDDQQYVRRMMNREQLIQWIREGEQELSFDFHIIDKKTRIPTWYGSRVYFTVNENEDNHCYMVWQVRNVDAERSKLARITTMAEKDALTGLYNRIAFQKQVETAFNEKQGSKHLSAFFMVDIDNFKTINDTFGHDFGDDVLKSIAAIIKSVFREDDSICRMGGDEFAIFIPRVSDKDIAVRKAIDLCRKIAISFEANQGKVSISCSVGLAFAPEAGTDFDTLYQKADDAQYRAKKSGKNQFVVYDPDNI